MSANPLNQIPCPIMTAADALALAQLILDNVGRLQIYCAQRRQTGSANETVKLDGVKAKLSVAHTALISSVATLKQL